MMRHSAGILVLCACAWVSALEGAAAQDINPPPQAGPSMARDHMICLNDRRATALDIIAACTRLLEAARPNDNAFALSDAYNERGRANAGLKRMDAALENFATAILLDPDNADANFNRATIYVERKNYPLALKDFDAAVAGNPMDGLAIFDRALVKIRLGDKAGAEEDFKAAAAIDPRFDDARARLGF